MPFKKGQSGNPSGTAKDKPWLDTLRRADVQDKHRRSRAGAEKFLDALAAGEPWAIKEWGDRNDGKPAQAIIGAGDDGEHVHKHYVVKLV
jgi:hypothetical protein